MSARALLLAASTFLLNGAAHAECQYKPFLFFPERNDRIAVSAIVEPGGVCRHKFIEGGGYRFTQLAPEKQPKHGVFQKNADGAFVYTAKAGYSGPDSYGFKICATKDGRDGCSRIVVSVDVTPQAVSARPTGCAYGAPDALAACTAIAEDKEKPTSERVRAYKLRGITQFRTRNLDAALADFSAVIDIAPDDAESFNNRGLTHQWRNEFDAAVADYDKAVALEPKMVGALVNRAIAYRLKGDLSAALIDAGRAVALDRKHAAAWKARAQALAAQGKYPDAIADFTTAMSLAPADLDARMLRADAYRRNGEDDRAIAEFDAIARAEPTYAPVWIERGKAMLERGSFQRADENLETALKLSPKDPVVLNLYGVAAMETGRFDTAIAVLSAAHDLVRAQPGILVNRGFAAFGKGDYAAARADFEKVAEGGLQKAWTPLWIYVVRARAGDKIAPPAMPEDAAWPAPVYAYMNGKIDRDALFAAARAGDGRKQDGQVCDATFYAGEKALIEGKAEEARSLLGQIADVCKSATVERAGGLGEYMRLKQ